MNNRLPPSKPLIVAAVLPIIPAIGCLIAFAHFGNSTGMIATFAALTGYYVIFGIIFAVISLKHDEAQKEFDRAAGTPLKIATVLLIIFTVGLIGGAITTFALGYKTAGFICVGAFVAFIAVFVVAMLCSARVRKTPPKSADKRGEGVCVYCAPYMQISYLAGMGKDGPKYKHNSTFRVIVEIDGRRLTANSYDHYNRDDTVNIAYSDRSKKCYIV